MAFVHIFAFRWASDVTDAQMAQVKTEILAFETTIPGLREMVVGDNLSPHCNGYGFAGVMRFADREAYETYIEHPSHQALLRWLRPLVSALEIDLQG